jgi:hypothetical protein
MTAQRNVVAPQLRKLSLQAHDQLGQQVHAVS